MLPASMHASMAYQVCIGWRCNCRPLLDFLGEISWRDSSVRLRRGKSPINGMVVSGRHFMLLHHLALLQTKMNCYVKFVRANNWPVQNQIVANWSDCIVSHCSCRLLLNFLGETPSCICTIKLSAIGPRLNSSRGSFLNTFILEGVRV